MSRTSPLRELIDQSMDELEAKTQGHLPWGFGTFDRWELDQDQGRLTFMNADGSKATANAQIIGTFNSLDNTWCWAWANESIAKEVAGDSATVKAYGEEHGFDRLTIPTFKATEDDAWEMTAIAVKLCETQGAYRGPVGTTFIFISFGEVKLS